MRVWRASDSMPLARDVLMRGTSAPLHVFGDLLNRVPDGTLSRLQFLKSSASAELEQTSAASAADRRAALQHIGALFMGQAAQLLKSVVFDPSAVAYCPKHGRLCPLHRPPEFPDVDIIQCAGTTCTSWSSVGQLVGASQPHP